MKGKVTMGNDGGLESNNRETSGQSLGHLSR